MLHPNTTPGHIQQTLHDRFPLVQQVFDLALERGTRIYLVGGAVRDILLGRVTHDLDFAVEGSGLRLSRFIADRLGGAYVALDPQRETGRVILSREQREGAESSQTACLDLASLRGSDLEQDLCDRDFTVNAIAIERDDLRQYRIVDPLNGQGDLIHRTLRAASSTAFERDPVRSLRAIRLSSQLGFEIHAQTLAALQSAAPQLSTISAERIRDEWFRILMAPQASAPLRDTHRYGLLERIAPPLARLAGAGRDAKGGPDHLTHALDTVTALERLWCAIQSPLPDSALELPDTLYTLRADLTRRYQAPICDERTYMGLLKCAALLHTVGISQVQANCTGPQENGEHQLSGAAIAEQLCRQWRLSNAEAVILSTTIRMYPHPAWLAMQPCLTRRAIHCYYREAGEAGIDAAMVALADHLAAGERAQSGQGWKQLIDTVTALLLAYLKHHTTVIDPPRLLTGIDLMREFGLQPGPQIGRALRQLREDQAAGQIQTRQEALAAVQDWLRCEQVPKPKEAI